MRRKIDYIPNGSKLTFIKKTTGRTIINGKEVHAKAIYRCSCGNEKEMIINRVQNGFSKSCGCLIFEVGIKHNLHKHPLYRVYHSMISRCYNKKDSNYQRYGGAGITVCNEWKSDFMSFYNWAINNGWKKGLHLDKDSIPMKNGDMPNKYSPILCKFVTPKENQAYKKDSLFVNVSGGMHKVDELSEIYHINPNTIRGRIRFNKLDSELVSPVKKKTIRFDNKELSITEWADCLKISKATIRTRLQRGFPVELVLSKRKLSKWH